MGSLSLVLPIKRDPSFKVSPRNEKNNNNSYVQRPRSRFGRFMVFKKIDYLQWISAIAVFIFFMFLFQLFLPLSMVEKTDGDFLKGREEDDGSGGNLKNLLKEIGGLDFGEDVKFVPTKFLIKFQREKGVVNNVTFDGSRTVMRFGNRKPQLALVFADLLVDPQQIMMVTVAVALRAVGYELEIYSLEDGPVRDIWKTIGVPVNIEPFKSVPLIWAVHEKALATRATRYIWGGQVELIDEWKTIFNRATVVVFPNYALPMFYAAFDAGNYFVVPGSTSGACKIDNSTIIYEENLRENMNISNDEFVVAIVGSEFLYNGIWLEHALVLQALLPLLTKFRVGDSLSPHLKIVILSRDLTGNYSAAMEEIASNLNYPRGTVNHASIDEDDGILGITDLVDDGVNGLLFPKEKMEALTEIMLQVVSDGKLSTSAQNIAKKGKNSAKNMMALESVEGYVSLIENILNLPSEVASPKAVSEIPSNIKTEWQWHLFEAITDRKYVNRTSRVQDFLNKVENRWNRTLKEESSGTIPANDTFVYSLWEEEKRNQIMKAKKTREDDEEVYKNAKKADRNKNDLHERDDGELERTGQPLCIYEPYFGQGSWPFLHRNSLYRGIGLSTKGRRSRRDDIDAPSRLPLLNTPYYRDTLGDFGAFLAVANRESLSQNAEIALLEDIEAQKHGDAVYFWVRMDKDPRNPTRQGNSTVLPPMPVDGDTWSVMHSWAMPTKSFLEFVMFSRMFVDALDAQVYDEHHRSGLCYLSLSKDKHCYSRILEILVNVWAYHSARRIVYINPNTGTMQEQHTLKKRKGKMWVKWFDYNTLKAMDEDLAEEADSEAVGRRWLWPSTGEVFWQGIYEKERIQWRKERETKKQKTRAKILRIKNRTHQKVIGKYVKPPPENATVAVARVYR
ncbi:hypothetical protein Ccrd_006880 [Cynara cardunculus var. scolymus]|uniref:Glycosyl transferase, family 1 n=1 Tax=Cynara cardunculus var. scolymus TaxID=59895 RepID=A0A103XHX8_CYNCS|nr:hypothetical protein Ccrd_006880 [Cynara cardunculus var. scolymus]